MGDSTGISWTDATWRRFLANVNKTAHCWLWTAGLFSNGYGQFRVGARKVRAHRAAYERLVGPIPDGLIVCHRCDNPRCVNPQHLFLGTHADNARDRDTKGRGGYRQPAPMPGASNPAARLTADQVTEIRALASSSTNKALAKRFGVAPTTISAVVRGVTWRNHG